MGEPWVHRSRPNPAARLRLICLPYAGGGASIFRTWSARLSAEVETCAVQLPGRENRLSATPFTRMDQLVPVALAELLPLLDRPFALFGHSMGAMVAFELARALRAAARPSPSLLFVSGRRPPHLAHAGPRVHLLPDGELVDVLRRSGGTPEEVLANPEIMDLMLPTLRADFELCETYEYRPSAPLACPIVALGGSEDVSVAVDDLEAWRGHTCGGFERHVLPGGHFFLHSAREGLLDVVSARLTDLLRAGGGR